MGHRMMTFSMLAVSSLALLTQTGLAATLTVTKIADTADGVCDSDCSLREALTAAAPGDSVQFSSLFDTPQTITLTGGQLLIDKDLNVIGPGADKLTVSGNNQNRVLHIQPSVSAIVRAMTITGGDANYGGGIFNEGTLTVESCHITANSAGSGGGLASRDLSITTVRNSTVSNNTAVNRGGAVWFNSSFGGVLSVEQSTLSGNSGSALFGNNGGGLYARTVYGLVRILNSTITDNFPGGAFVVGESVEIQIASSVIAANQNNSSVPDIDGGPFLAICCSNNFFGHQTSGFAESNITGNPIVQADPKLGPLADNGGPTLTHALLPCSLAIDRGIQFAGSTDQRGTGFDRVRDGDGDGLARSDMGAFELQSYTPAICNTGPPVFVSANPTIEQGTSAWLDIASVTDPDGLFGVGMHVLPPNPSNGVEIANLSMYPTAGIFSANVTASCTASTASFTFLGGDWDYDVPGTVTVTVTPETVPPVIMLRTDPITLYPNDHKYQLSDVLRFISGASDNCDASLDWRSVSVEKVTSDEPENAPGRSDGNTLDDIVIAPDCRSVRLRAERDGDGDGRVYTVTLRVSDASGNTVRAARKVTVPLSQNGSAAIEGPPSYTVTSNCLLIHYGE